MTESEIEHIRLHARRFRWAFDNSAFDDMDGNLSRFPRECCHHACSLLRIYFSDIGIDGFVTVSGNRPDGEEGKHLWLRNGDIVVDITADQFDEEKQPSVIVSRNSAWHVGLVGIPMEHSADADDRVRSHYESNLVLPRLLATLNRIK